MERIEEIFRSRRITLGLTQEAAARAAGVARRTVVGFESGTTSISLANLKALLRAVGLELTTREASPRPTLDEVHDRYRSDDGEQKRQRVRKKKAS